MKDNPGQTVSLGQTVLPGIPKKRGRPKSSTKTRAVQLKEAKRRHRQRMADSGLVDLHLVGTIETARIISLLAQEFDETRSEMIGIVVRKFFESRGSK